MAMIVVVVIIILVKGTHDWAVPIRWYFLPCGLNSCMVNAPMGVWRACGRQEK